MLVHIRTMGLTDTSDLLRCIGMCSVRILEIRPSQYLIAYRLVKLCLPPSPSLVNAHLSLPKTVQLTLEASKHGLGRHGWDVPIDELRRLYTVSITALSTSQIHVDSSNQYTKMSTHGHALDIGRQTLALTALFSSFLSQQGDEIPYSFRNCLLPCRRFRWALGHESRAR